MSVLSKEEFIQQYVLARANTINSNGPGGSINSTGAAEAAKEVFEYIERVCGVTNDNINQQ